MVAMLRRQAKDLDPNDMDGMCAMHETFVIKNYRKVSKFPNPNLDSKRPQQSRRQSDSITQGAAEANEGSPLIPNGVRAGRRGVRKPAHHHPHDR